MALEKKDIT